MGKVYCTPDFVLTFCLTSCFFYRVLAPWSPNNNRAPGVGKHFHSAKMRKRDLEMRVCTWHLQAVRCSLPIHRLVGPSIPFLPSASIIASPVPSRSMSLASFWPCPMGFFFLVELLWRGKWRALLTLLARRIWLRAPSWSHQSKLNFKCSRTSPNSLEVIPVAASPISQQRQNIHRIVFPEIAPVGVRSFQLPRAPSSQSPARASYCASCIF